MLRELRSDPLEHEYRESDEDHEHDDAFKVHVDLRVIYRPIR